MIMIMGMLRAPTNQAWHREKAIPAADDGGGAVVPAGGGGGGGDPMADGVGAVAPEVDEGDPTGLADPAGETVMASFIPDGQCSGKPHMYHWLPEVASVITSSPEVRGYNMISKVNVIIEKSKL
ncbi:hypothetical protein RHSIM_Rhsim07G0097800 [Rhododendron simsii]|uniref:Uncharacterized protein n=1 Tax=Rhododendron simsii TaxID=118357 RepID=A0A834GQ65_RHOSS|nr:hypothetical protein RHSIM_Rhsim07G0097800 [Rhododendron simsii]